MATRPIDLEDLFSKIQSADKVRQIKKTGSQDKSKQFSGNLKERLQKKGKPPKDDYQENPIQEEKTDEKKKIQKQMEFKFDREKKSRIDLTA